MIENIMILTENILKTGLYLFIVTFIYLYNADYERNHLSLKFNYKVMFSLLVSILYCLYSIFICESHHHISDRTRYALRFESNRIDTWTTGLQFIGNFLLKYSNNRYVLFFVICFISIYLIMYSMLSSNIKKSSAIYMLLISEIAMYPFFAFKQAISIAFSTLAFNSVFERKKIKCIVFIVLAILFHEAAFILIPIFVFLLFSKEKSKSIFIFLPTLLFFTLFFSKISPYFISFFRNNIPILYDELFKNGYLTNDTIFSESNFLTIVKGLPIYFITLFSLNERNKLKDKIYRYDNYLLLCIFASCMHLSAFHMYWMVRFAFYFYFPIFIYWSRIMDEFIKIDFRKRNFYNLSVIFSLTFFNLRYLYLTYRNFGGF